MCQLHLRVVLSACSSSTKLLPEVAFPIEATDFRFGVSQIATPESSSNTAYCYRSRLGGRYGKGVTNLGGRDGRRRAVRALGIPMSTLPSPATIFNFKVLLDTQPPSCDCLTISHVTCCAEQQT